MIDCLCAPALEPQQTKMRFNLKILARTQLFDYVKNNNNASVIAIIESKLHPISVEHLKFIDRKSYNLLNLYFDDINFPYRDLKVVERHHIESALAFAKNMPDDIYELAIGCAAGVSRSSALAYVIARNNGYNIDNALALLNRNYHHPNMLMLHLASQVCHTDYISEMINNWSKTSDAPIPI